VNERQRFALTHPVERGARARDLVAPSAELLRVVQERRRTYRDKRTGLMINTVLAVDR
jgi:hypothetical protein